MQGLGFSAPRPVGPSRAVAAGQGAASASTDEYWAAQGTRVLIVDDEAETGAMLRTALVGFAYDVKWLPIAKEP